MPLRAAILIAFGGLSLITLAGFVSRGGSSEGVQPATIEIEVGDNWFCDPGDSACMVSDIDVLDLITYVSVGDTVTWNFVEGSGASSHTTTSDTGVWDSGQVDAPGTFSFTFETAGIFHYICETHPIEMRGVIVVEAAEPGLIAVSIDIKPGSDRNSTNLSSRGVIPVAILTTPDFDAATVDPATIGFEGASPVRDALQDVDGDGDLDLIMHFRTQETNIADEATEGCLAGETTAGQPIAGCDAVRIVP